ncbi:FKBP-type peptidyl-prolyl cis-trans isomerase [Thalassolituus marinus]|uniref:Peptidyl-prolyl cis-trans isomerase n=1 Tax=Thalassolituus marinus TaxID=671053 RepID=A0ABS7ZRK2_9GAMM|nr:peptidylprolyl isomerase [Thalassolituus marinus]MCA6064281.1 peptidylprolyl isomerase [Thalassolituus marinus]
MKIAKDTVVQLHYSLFDAEGNMIESTTQGNHKDPVAYLHGHNNMIKGFESEVEGMEAGAEGSFTLAPAQAYGERHDNAVARVPVKHLQGAKNWKKGMTAWVETDQGTRQVTIVKMGRFMADVDTNHPLAGKTLRFDVRIESVRHATPEEIDHGHAHGVGGHQH